MERPEGYLGDGVYATWDGGQVWLDCRAQPDLSIGPNGVPGIALDSSVLRALLEFVAAAQSKGGTP